MTRPARPTCVRSESGPPPSASPEGPTDGHPPRAAPGEQRRQRRQRPDADSVGDQAAERSLVVDRRGIGSTTTDLSPAVPARDSLSVDENRARQRASSARRCGSSPRPSVRRRSASGGHAAPSHRLGVAAPTATAWSYDASSSRHGGRRHVGLLSHTNIGPYTSPFLRRGGWSTLMTGSPQGSPRPRTADRARTHARGPMPAWPSAHPTRRGPATDSAQRCDVPRPACGAVEVNLRDAG